MKKFILAICALAMLGLTISCKNNEKQNKPEDDTFCIDTMVIGGGYQFEKVVMLECKNFSDCIFYEAQVKFDRDVYDENPQIDWMLLIFQKGDTCIQVTYDENGERTVAKVNSPWLEDKPINFVDETDFTLYQVINIVQHLETPMTSEFMTFRKPLTKEDYQNPFFIFGTSESTTGFVAINAKTGEVEKW